VDFRFTSEEQAFRQEVIDFLDENLPPELEGVNEDQIVNDDEIFNTAQVFLKRLSARGWLCPHWPKEYGGAGMSIMEQVIFKEEMSYRDAPTNIGPGVNQIGSTLLVHGTEEQKQRFLPPTASGDIIWCLGYSEPGAGSDLASLQTTAVLDGDDYVINGQKIWTSWATRADWMLIMARTNPEAPKHRGLTIFLLDMKSPGVTVRPITDMAGRTGFINQDFFDNVRVPRENMVGELDRGWYVGVTLLDYERSNIASGASARREFQRFLQFTLENKDQTGRRLFDIPAVRQKMVEHKIAIEVGIYMSYRVASLQNRGLVPNHEASVAKLYYTDLHHKFNEMRLGVLGLYGQLRPENLNWVKLGGRPAMSSMACFVAGGSNEIQRSIIATRGLGMPRS
jgi:alkylation response protein AidB-like acyl-CoA dehydrogenase